MRGAGAELLIGEIPVELDKTDLEAWFLKIEPADPTVLDEIVKALEH